MNLFEVAVAFFVIFSNFVVILFQKVTFPMKLSIRRLLLSNSVPLQLSKCSCDSCASVSHNLQVRFSFQDFLAFIFTFANDLARYLKYTRLFAMDNVWRYCLSLGLSSILSATFLLDFILSRHSSMILFFTAFLSSAFVTSLLLGWVKSVFYIVFCTLMLVH